MSGAFNRAPDWLAYADAQGIKVEGRGVWRSILCDFHDDTKPSLRINTKSGGWRCMSCGAKGGDTLDHYMQRTGLGFAAAARDLGAWDDAAQPHAHPSRPRRFSARDALEVVERELNVCVVVLSDARRGTLPSDTDWKRFLQAAGLVGAIAMEARQ